MKRILGSLIALGLLYTAAYAAVTSNSAVLPQTPSRGIVQFLQGTDPAGTYKTVYTGGTNGSKCISGYITSNDAVSHLLTFQLVNSAVKYGGMAIVTGTSTPGFASGAAPLPFMNNISWPGLPIDSDGNYFIFLASGDTLQATFATALTSSTLINVVVVCGDY